MGKTYISPEAAIIKMENNLMRDFASKANTNNAADDSGNITDGPEIGEGAAPNESKYNCCNVWEEGKD